MTRINGRENFDNVYDDYMEPLSDIRKQYQKFSMNEKEYVTTKTSCPWLSFSGGVPVLADEDDKYVFVDSHDTHTLVLGSTGSKKTRLIVMPTVRLLGWSGESMIVSDPKAEIYNRTAGELEKEGYRIIVLNFRNPTLGDCWNPLSIPYHFYQEGDIDRACEMVNDIAKNILASDGESKDPFWQDSAADLFFGLVLTLFKLCFEEETGEMAVNISNVLKLRRQLFDNNSPDNSPIWKYVKDDEVIAPALSGIVLTAKDTRAGILSTFDQKIRYFAYQPNLLDMLANNSIMLDQICEVKTAVYLIMPDEKTTYHMLISLFVKQSYEYLIYKAQESISGKMKIRLNYILDEFSSLPTIKDFPAMITAARSRNIRFCLIIQSKHQLNQRYGKETESIQSNCGNWIFLTSREVPLLEEISTLCGKVHEGRMPLVSVFTLQHLDKESGQALMLCGRNRPYYALLPDIDRYDDGMYVIRGLDYEWQREKRIEIDSIEITGRKTEIGTENEEEYIKRVPELKSMSFSIPLDIEKHNVVLSDSLEYAIEAEAGMKAYTKKDYMEAKQHFIAALQARKGKMTACDCENNLAYMLRRKEVDEIVMDDIVYDVPELLEKGVREKKPFFLINMALYASVMGNCVEMSRGDYYIKQIDEDGNSVQKWWEDLAKEGELEGYMVLYWLFQHQVINTSVVGARERILHILKTQFHINPLKVSEIKKDK